MKFAANVENYQTRPEKSMLMAFLLFSETSIIVPFPTRFVMIMPQAS